MTSLRDRGQREPAALRAALVKLAECDPKDFTKLRKSLAAELAEAGDDESARIVAAARKPDRAANALNRLALNDGKLVRAVFDAFDAATKEQGAERERDPDVWRRALSSYRERVAAVAHAVDVSAGGADAAFVRRVSQTLQAAAVDPEARERLLAGRLEKSGQTFVDTLAGLGAPKPHAKATAHDEPPQSTTRLRPARRAPRTKASGSDLEEKERAKLERDVARARKRISAAEAKKNRAEAELEAARADLGTLLR